MASSISWLDTSAVEQKRMREILGLFTEKESREELGLGQIRDALSDGLFPGTSTLHTRAKYFLFIPWIYQQVSARGGSTSQARYQELELIKALKSNGRDDVGIIGADAGSALKTVPSVIYWSALGAYGILLDSRASREHALDRHGAELPGIDTSVELDAQKPRTQLLWRGSLPDAPEGFPRGVPDGMALKAEEAAWLQERIIDSAPNSLLSYLATNAPHSESLVPWEDPVALASVGEARLLLDHAERFSDTVQGAQLLYNLLIAESYEREGLTRLEGRRDHFSQRLTAWGERFTDRGSLRAWDIDDFFALVTKARGLRVGAGSEAFVRGWVEMLRSRDPRGLVTDEVASKFVQDRERRNKGAMARIGNAKRLETWGGSSGAGRYVYRWSYVQTILGDIHAGFATSDTSVDVDMLEAAEPAVTGA